jgi:branched-chain amino acid transport system ATP-binding protein
MTVLLSARDLQKRFGAVVAADAVNIDVPAGQRLSVIGSNGAGKTTFVNMVTGYLKPDSGAIHLEDRDITRLSHRQIAAAGGKFSLWRAADEAANHARAETLLGRFGLVADAERPVAELAGGVRKLLDIALALARRPKLLMLDEPTSGVSAEEKFAAMERVMEALEGEAATVLFVEHDMDIVSRFSERVIAFYSGRVIADGAPAHVLADADVIKYVTGGTAQ